MFGLSKKDKIRKKEKANKRLCFEKQGLEKELEEVSIIINENYRKIGQIIISEGIVTGKEQIDIDIKNDIEKLQQKCQDIRARIEGLDGEMVENLDDQLMNMGKVRCENCNNIVVYKSDERFCPKCGWKLKEIKS